MKRQDDYVEQVTEGSDCDKVGGLEIERAQNTPKNAPSKLIKIVAVVVTLALVTIGFGVWFGIASHHYEAAPPQQ